MYHVYIMQLYLSVYPYLYMQNVVKSETLSNCSRAGTCHLL